ncbi:MAG: hypothetical protein M1813_001335 [Trichoglossum hirsutum]|nr:MAG: hypothetical protein M1813_001335 [Trichoglossum hirsutum]
MSDNSLIQPFSGIGYKPIHIKMYLKGVQFIVNKTAEDEDDKKELYSMYFYNGLRGEAKLWFERLSVEIQEDWEKIKEEFQKRFGQEDSEKQQLLYFHRQVKALRQGKKTITKYLKEGEELAALAPNEQMEFSLAQSFIEGLNDQQHRQILDLNLPDNIYSFQEVKTAVKKLYIQSPESTSASAYSVAATAVEADPLQKVTQALQLICDKMTMHSASPRAPSPYRLTGTPRPERCCYNCMELGHICPECTLAPVSAEQLQANREKVYKETEELLEVERYVVTTLGQALYIQGDRPVPYTPPGSPDLAASLQILTLDRRTGNEEFKMVDEMYVHFSNTLKGLCGDIIFSSWDKSANEYKIVEHPGSPYPFAVNRRFGKPDMEPKSSIDSKSKRLRAIVLQALEDDNNASAYSISGEEGITVYLNVLLNCLPQLEDRLAIYTSFTLAPLDKCADAPSEHLGRLVKFLKPLQEINTPLTTHS